MFEDPWCKLLSEEEASTHAEQLAAQIAERCRCVSGVKQPPSSTESKDKDTFSEPQKPPSTTIAEASDALVSQKSDSNSVGSPDSSPTNPVESSQLDETVPAGSDGTSLDTTSLQ